MASLQPRHVHIPGFRDVAAGDKPLDRDLRRTHVRPLASAIDRSPSSESRRSFAPDRHLRCGPLSWCLGHYWWFRIRCLAQPTSWSWFAPHLVRRLTHRTRAHRLTVILIGIVDVSLRVERTPMPFPVFIGVGRVEEPFDPHLHFAIPLTPVMAVVRYAVAHLAWRIPAANLAGRRPISCRRGERSESARPLTRSGPGAQ